MSKYIGGYREYNLNWKGGRVSISGYFYRFKPNHNLATKKGYVAEHRLIWEEYHKACLLPWGTVHHKNENKKDNRIENLEGMSKRQHIGLHNKIEKTLDFKNRVCLLCLSTYDDVKNKGRHYWFKVVEGFICRKCHDHIKYMSK